MHFSKFDYVCVELAQVELLKLIRPSNILRIKISVQLYFLTFLKSWVHWLLHFTFECFYVVVFVVLEVSNNSIIIRFDKFIFLFNINGSPKLPTSQLTQIWISQYLFAY